MEFEPAMWKSSDLDDAALTTAPNGLMCRLFLWKTILDESFQIKFLQDSGIIMRERISVYLHVLSIMKLFFC
jgi:hypothetical protein